MAQSHNHANKGEVYDEARKVRIPTDDEKQAEKRGNAKPKDRVQHIRPDTIPGNQEHYKPSINQGDGLFLLPERRKNENTQKKEQGAVVCGADDSSFIGGRHNCPNQF